MYDNIEIDKNLSIRIDEIISQLKLLAPWLQDFSLILSTITIIIILFSQNCNLKKFVVFWCQMAQSLMAVRLKWHQEFKKFWCHFGANGAILVSNTKIATIDEFSASKLSPVAVIMIEDNTN